MQTNSPDVVIAMRLLDHDKLRGFEFLRVAPGEDRPLVGNRMSGGWVDTICIEGFSRDCFAWRKRNLSLIVAGNELMECRVDGSALAVLNEVLMCWPGGSATHVALCGALMPTLRLPPSKCVGAPR
jgi:hypothetical protein